MSHHANNLERLHCHSERKKNGNEDMSRAGSRCTNDWTWQTGVKNATLQNLAHSAIPLKNIARIMGSTTKCCQPKKKFQNEGRPSPKEVVSRMRKLSKMSTFVILRSSFFLKVGGSECRDFSARNKCDNQLCDKVGRQTRVSSTNRGIRDG